ncbi:outer membrane homotrimeric porin [uncultured Desulfovibrio sp.]|uniref:outer membrane homotrimeric porin n=1 Tax=uncultured Desulfovibrio sp. TaxID=167968 RepID=UPI00262267FD|nr:outer membrane homotrimeric porin [uncultured Desulfovibrio sp.]
MKKIWCLLLAAAMMAGAARPSHAVEFKAKGVWLTSFQYGQNGNFTHGGHTGYDPSEDEFEARSRVRLLIDAVADENLSGQVYFEIGKSIWGKDNNPQGGMALGADASIIKLKRAYIDWRIPDTDMKLRMGIQGIGLPYMAMDGPTVFQSDVAAITVSHAFNDNVSLSAFWARPYNDNYAGGANGSQANFMDNMDMAGLVLPLRFDGLKLTPWGMFAAIGPNTFRNNNGYINQQINGVNGNYIRSGMLPLRADLLSHGEKLNAYGTAWWGGISGEIAAWEEPFRIAWDAMYGSVTYGDSSLNRAGWMAALLLEYKLDWTTLGLYGWYSSGDDDDTGNGSERLPTISNDYGVASFSGTFIGPDINGVERDRVIGNNLVGTWGVGFRLKDMSFWDDLKHTFHISLLGGTNAPGILKKFHEKTGYWMTPNNPEAQGVNAIGRESMYLTTRDYAVEFGLLNEYKIYDNLQLNVEASYVAPCLDMSDDVWGQSLTGGNHRDLRDAWNVSMLFIYAF